MFTNFARIAGLLAIGSATLLHCPDSWAQTHVERPDASPLFGATETQEFRLEKGEQRVISSDSVRSYSEGTKGVVDIRLTRDSSQFVIVGIKPGKTTVLFLMMDGTERHIKIEVFDQETRSVSDGVTPVEARDNIRLDFYFVQVSKSYGHQLGMNWPPSIAPPDIDVSYDFLQGSFGSASAVVSNQPLPHLDVAQTSGWAKIMRQAAVVTANGEKATFSGGGEINILVQSAVGTGMQQVSFGSLIDVEPRYDSESGRIELRLHADISELESDRGAGVPGRTTTGLDTVVNLEMGQSLILAGLSSKSKRRTKRGLPGLSQLPIIGFLFGTQSQAEEEVENIVVIVPTVVDAVTMQDRKRIKDALSTYENYKGKIDEVDFIPEANVQRKPASKPGAP